MDALGSAEALVAAPLLPVKPDAQAASHPPLATCREAQVAATVDLEEPFFVIEEPQSAFIPVSRGAMVLGV